MEIVRASYNDPDALTRALTGVDVAVSSLSGTRDVVVNAQTAFLEAAVRAWVPRFIPSDYASDYRRAVPGSNRNFELRKEFASTVDASHIRATSIFNGGFAKVLSACSGTMSAGLRRGSVRIFV